MCVREQWTADLEIPHVIYSSLHIFLNKYFFKIPLESKLASNLRISQKLTNLYNCFLSDLQSNHTKNPTWGVTKVKGAKTFGKRAEPSTPGLSPKDTGDFSDSWCVVMVEKHPNKEVKSWLKSKTKALEDPCKLFEVGVVFFVVMNMWQKKCWGKFMIDWFGSVWCCFQNRHLVSKYNSNILNCFFKHRFHTLKVTTIYLHQETKKTQKKREKKMSRHQFKNTTGPWKLASLKASFRYRVYSHHYLLVNCHSLLVIHLL